MAKSKKKSSTKTSEERIVIAGCYHIPVLLHESVDALDIRPDGIYIDTTHGGGGHSREILSRLGEGGRLFGVDRDLDALDNCTIDDERFTFVRSNFRHIAHFMDYYGVDKVDGILADLGVSSHHLDDEERGFSFRFDAPIDMRMNQAGGRTAAMLIKETEVGELARILKTYGEVKGSYKIASLLKEADAAGELSTIADMLEAIRPVCPPHDKKNLARIFQALRIAVNEEIDALRELLEVSVELLRPGGRLSVITYHSLEDRPVKNFIRTGNIDGMRHTDVFGAVISPMEPLGSKPILPSAEEIAANPRSRSAKLRIGVRKED
ncbi:16S rRNA (cytosine(1402)-N(4))-methyltransferase RsmH [Porphyromonas sp.]|uniref:16S rRNA (cytosine(1402)-N(4))-methyltransferase RsmH n=1 Tax=Porphyromonas sp. TaxID=1924944 RepID=UPI0026DD0732|nr:16S rRNA (cytosine(1402)-N(4))-methyltransferase RsmH [Porphyromonas sp.]MDO4770628.1 16S rRNA (cytosine(1402)-N(4))-methyltransferase RsmH [Porphyromonas sp.]